MSRSFHDENFISTTINPPTNAIRNDRDISQLENYRLSLQTSYEDKNLSYRCA